MVHWVGKESRVFGPLVGDSLGDFDSCCFVHPNEAILCNSTRLPKSRETGRAKEKKSFTPRGFYVLSRLDVCVSLEKNL